MQKKLPLGGKVLNSKQNYVSRILALCKHQFILTCQTDSPSFFISFLFVLYFLLWICSPLPHSLKSFLGFLFSLLGYLIYFLSTCTLFQPLPGNALKIFSVQIILFLSSDPISGSDPGYSISLSQLSKILNDIEERWVQ